MPQLTKRDDIKRKWATKTRSGCRTCKKKRVKCDEIKPSCGRCTRLSLVCGGYEDLTYKPPVDCTNPRSYVRVIAPRSSVSSTTSSTAASEYDLGRRHSAPARSSASPTSIATWISSTLTPYQTTAEQHGLQIWLETMQYMGRSDVGLKVWTNIIPSMAWSHAAVRHIQTATALVLGSFRQQATADQYKETELLSLRHAKFAVQAVLEEQVPIDVRIVVSMVLWMYDIVMGRSLDASQHLANAYRLSKLADLKSVSEPLICLYCLAFAGEWTETLNPMKITGLSRTEQSELLEGRIRYSKDILLHARRTSQSLIQTVGIKLQSCSPVHEENYLRAKVLLESSDSAFDSVINGWPHPADFVCDDRSSKEVTGSKLSYDEAIRKYSPFKPILRYFEAFFDDHDETHLLKFHLQFRPCIDLFMWIAAGSDLDARKAIMPLWNVQWTISPRASTILER